MYQWVLSPSKFESAAGCPCFEEDFSENEDLKERGSMLHDCMEKQVIPTDLSQADIEALEFCREADEHLDDTAGPFILDVREIYIRRNDRHPVAKIDRLCINEQRHAFVTDYKFGQGEVADLADNIQVKSYVTTVQDECEQMAAGQPSAFDGILPKELVPLTGITGLIVQPANGVAEGFEYDLSRKDEIITELKARNERVADPFKQPDPGDPAKCGRCMHAHRCPAVTSAVAEFARRTEMLPMPEVFEPGAQVTVRDRVIAQDIAGILEAWAKRVKQHNRAFAAENGNTLGGVYNLSTRGNGYELRDTPGFIHKLLLEKVFEHPTDIIPYIKISKTALIDGLAEVSKESKADIAEIVNRAYEEFGDPRPPVTVFRKGGKAKIEKAVELLDIPQIRDPFK